MGLSKALPKDFFRFFLLFLSFFETIPLFCLFLGLGKINRKNIVKGVDSFVGSAKVFLS